MNRREEEEKIRMENILSGNPLLKEKYAEVAKSDMKVGTNLYDITLWFSTDFSQGDKCFFICD